MNNTKAAEVIIHALWPGPEPLMFDLTLLVAVSAWRAALLTYASRSRSRCSTVGSLGAGAAAAGAAAAGAVAAASSAAQTRVSESPATISRENRDFFMCIMGLNILMGNFKQRHRPSLRFECERLLRYL